MFAHLVSNGSDSDDDDDNSDDGHCHPAHVDSESDSEHGPGAAVVAPVEAAGAAVVAPRLHNRLNERHSNESKLKMSLGAAKAKIRSLEDREKAYDASTNISFSQHVASTCFGNRSPDTQKIIMLRSGDIANVPLVRSANRSATHQSHREYAIASAVYGQAAGIANMIKDNPNIDLVSSSCMDDASMWVKDPASKADRESGVRSEGIRVGPERKLWIRGKKICLPFCNLAEEVFASRPCAGQHSATSVMVGCDVHSPSQALVKANAVTIIDRMKRWHVISPFGPGDNADPEGHVSAALAASDLWQTSVITRDNIGLNDNIIGYFQNQLTLKLDSGTEDYMTSATILSICCFGHSCCLTTKLVADRADQLPGKLVRMGHLHESGKISSQHAQAVETIVSRRFRFTAVTELPESFAANRSRAAAVLRLSRPAGDLSEADEQYILDIDNSSWDSLDWEHICLGPNCRAKCGGDPVTAKCMMVKAAKLSVTSYPSAPLQYRWKGVEQFAAKLWRTKKHHGIAVESHEIVWPDADVRDARKCLEALAPAAAESPDAVRHKAQVRGGMTVDFLRSDADAMQTEKLILLQSASQGFLNKCFAAEAAVTKYSQRVALLPSDTRAPPDYTLTDMRQSAIDRNWHILSGDAGIALLSEYSRYLSFESEVWEHWSMAGSDDAKYNMCLDLVIVMQDAYNRLVFKCDIPNLEIFEVCKVGEGLDFDLQRVQAIARTLKSKYDRCKFSVDRTFTLIWVTRLLFSDASCRKAHLCLRNILSVIRVTSTRVERKHLVGQELIPVKRGAALECSQLAKHVFQKLVLVSVERHRSHAYAQCLGSPATAALFSRCLTEHCCQGHSDRRSEAAASKKPNAKQPQSAMARIAGRLKVTQVRGYDMYSRSNFSDSLEGNTIFEKRKSMDLKWKALSENEKNGYKNAAAAENARVAERGNETFPEFLARMEREPVVVRSNNLKHLRERFKSVHNSLDEIVNHDVYSAGSRMHDFSHGIRPEIIETDWTRQQAHEECRRLFDYDHKPCASPSKLPRCFYPCTQLCGGICCTSTLAESAQNLTYNLYARCSRWKSEFPIMLELTSEPVKEFVLLGRLVGTGQLAMFSKLAVTHVDASPGQHAYDVAALVLSEGRALNPTAIPTTSHKFFTDFMARVSQSTGVDPCMLMDLTMRRWSFQKEAGRHFRMRLTSVHSEETLQCAVKVGVKRGRETEDDEIPFGLGKRIKTGETGFRGEGKKADPEEHASDSDSESDADQGCCSGSAADQLSNRDDVSEGDWDDAGDDDAGHIDGPGEPADDGEDALDDEPWNCVGIKSWEKAPAGARANCCHCKTRIQPNTYRLDYRFKVSLVLGDALRLHPECAEHLPLVSRERDIRFLNRATRDLRNSAKDRVMLSQVLARIGG